ncbi:MAG: Glu/Leu/Phe/Val dehydrogenase dimerization domain-containing protein [Gemmatimonadota bacterium]
MRTLIEGWDGHAVVTRHDRATGTWFFIAVHDPTLGMPVGGCRMKSYPTPEDGLRDAMRLAEGMTYKWAAIDFPFGGGKGVLAVPHPLVGPEREALLRRFGRLVDSLNGAFATGEDLGTTPSDMGIMAEECRYIMGQSGPEGESADPGPYTALGVFTGILVAVRHALGHEGLEGRRVLVQGVGDVGAPLARLLAGAGAELLVSDLDAAKAEALAAEIGAGVVPPEEVYGAECDVYAPCAVGATVNSETIPRMRCHIVAGSANNQLESESDADRLHERGILYAPDYIVNAGGAIAFGLMHGGVTDDAELRARVVRVGDSLAEIFADAAASGESPAHAARRKAERVLERARAARVDAA